MIDFSQTLSIERQKRITTLESVDSTNTYLKNMAQRGIDEGQVVIASSQTLGRGRMGRSFFSPDGCGIYLSYLIKVGKEIADLTLVSFLTSWTAVAVCDTIKSLYGFEPSIKWVNDIILGGKKVCGILCESVFANGENNVIIGIGLNVLGKESDFSSDLQKIATSLYAFSDKKVPLEVVASSLINRLDKLSDDLKNPNPATKESYYAKYKSKCISLYKEVNVIRKDETRKAFSLALNEDFSLRVRYEDSSEEDISSGEVSVRQSGECNGGQ